MSKILLIIALTFGTSFTLLAQSTNNQMLAQNTNNSMTLHPTAYASLDAKPTPKKLTPKKAMELRQNVAMEIRKLLGKQVEYPSIAVDYCIEGMVVLEVSIGEAGNIQGFEVVKSPHKVLDQELSRSMNEVKDNQLIPISSQEPFKVIVPFRFRLQ